MAEKTETKKPENNKDNKPTGQREKMRRPNRPGSKKPMNRQKQDPHGVDKQIISIRRVARTYKGGKRLRLSVFVVVGDRKGKVGVGIGKGLDVKTAEEKAINKAKKNMVKVTLKGTTIPHEITYKKGAARVFMKPAAPGTGVIAGGTMRAVLDMAGVKDILTKVIGSPNSIANAYATLEALQVLKTTANNAK